MALSFHRPWWLLLAAPVAVAAILALVRPRRRRLVVASLSLWQEAAALAAPASSDRRWADPSWLALLAGALLAVLAAGDPRIGGGDPVRRVAVEIVPSAELAGPGGLDRLREAGRAMLERLDPRDRVELLLPAGSGGGLGATRSPAEAQRALESLRAIPLPAGRVTLPAPSPGVDRLCRLAPAGEGDAPSPGRSDIQIAPSLAPVTIDAAGFDDNASGDRLLVALRSHAPTPRVARIVLTGIDVDGSRTELASVRRDVRAGARVTKVFALPAGDSPAGLIVEVLSGGGADRLTGSGDREAWLPGTRAYLARRQRREARVAIIGDASRWLERFVQASPRAVRVVDANRAEVVFAVGREAPAGAAALVIDPSTAPTGWRRGPARGPIVLAGADALADDPLLADVDLAGLGVRRANPLISSARSGWRAVVRHRGDGLILRREDAGDAPRRVHVAFALDEDNTNASVSVAWLAFLANVLEYLAPEASGRTDYCWVWPDEAMLAGASAVAGGGEAPGGLPAEGLYLHDDDGELVGVSVIGLRGGGPIVEAEVAVRDVPLPSARGDAEPVAAWPIMMTGAMALWSAGWWLRRRGRPASR